ncbi:unnamed protein product, partial [Hapterophycus canaliculatus]
QCWCSKTLKDLGDSNACDYDCASNDDDEICGGYDAMSVYAIGSDSGDPSPVIDPTPAPSPAPVGVQPSPGVSGDGFASIGCWSDDRSDRIMGAWFSSGSPMSAEVCFQVCNDGSNTHFGTQFGKECFCVDDPTLESIEKHGELDTESHCLTECEGGPGGETCGGYNEMSVYEIAAASETASSSETD